MECRREKTGFITKEHKADFCVVGGGIAGMCAAVAAARRGVKVVLMQDRPVLGGNASSEVRMWIRGAHGADMRETGIVEELALENCYRNPDMNFSIWDSVLYGLVKGEENITLLLNCSCLNAEMKENRIVSVTGWQLTTQEYHKVTAAIFADCSGDSVLAPLTGAEYRVGREARGEFQEDIAPEEGDLHTMGMSCLIQARQVTNAVPFTPPAWAHHYEKEDFPYRIDFSSRKSWQEDNFWWMEIGGMRDSIHDTESCRDELLKIAYGVWDFIKNSGEVDASDWTLEWLGFLPGKRESRRYVGEYILNQNDIRSEGRFEDIIAYGGWSMDDHHPAGMQTAERPTIYHEAPSPYGIPYRCLYSVNIENLMFAGRNISVTHTACASARVMATCGVIGQAVGNAAALAISKQKNPKELYPDDMKALQKNIMEDGCYLPWQTKPCDGIMRDASVYYNGEKAEVLLDGIERKVNGCDHALECEKGAELVLDLGETQYVSRLRLVFDSDLNRDTWENQNWIIKDYPMKCNVFLNENPVTVPKTIVKEFQVDIQNETGTWECVYAEENNYQRQRIIEIRQKVKQIRCTLKDTWGFEKIRIYAVEALE